MSDQQDEQQILTKLPADLPKPIDDGKSNHLLGLKFPLVELLSTDGGMISTDLFKTGKYIIYCYPMTGRPDMPLPANWDSIPGARGCTPESLGFADHYDEFIKAGFKVYGLSTQDQAYQQEMVKRLRLPFPVLSDSNLFMTKALNLPTFTLEDKILLKRLTMIIVNGVIKKVFYPVFPPDKHAVEVLNWIADNNK